MKAIFIISLAIATTLTSAAFAQSVNGDNSLQQVIDNGERANETLIQQRQEQAIQQQLEQQREQTQIMKQEQQQQQQNNQYYGR